MTAELTLRYVSSAGGTYGRLTATVKSGAFRGEGAMWVSPEYVKETFISALRQYPLTPDSFPNLEGGYSAGDSSGSLGQKHLRISIKPYDALGALLVHVELATDFQTNPDKDRQQTVASRFLAQYAALPTFASDLNQVLDQEKEAATLQGFEGRHEF